MILRVRDYNGQYRTIPAIRGDRGEKGEKGDRGDPGPRGPQGLPAEGAVLSINGKQPDAQGAVTLNAREMGALTTSGGALKGELDMQGHSIHGLPQPLAASDAACKGYVDSKHLCASFTLFTEDWQKTGEIYTAVKQVTGITAQDIAHAAPVFSQEMQLGLAQQEAWGLVFGAETGDGSIRFFSYDTPPDTDIPMIVEVNR